jgi:hypothetical protein
MREPPSMSWFEWWVANLLQGSVGALIGMLGLFAVFWFTVRHEWALERVRVAEENKRLERQRTADSVAEVVKASSLFAKLGGIDREAATDALSSALILMSVRERAAHPKASEWVVQEANLIWDLSNPSINTVTRAYEAGQIGSTLARWAADGFRGDFQFPPVKPKKVRVWEVLDDGDRVEVHYDEDMFGGDRSQSED